jgi:hypothetical protein
MCSLIRTFFYREKVHETLTCVKEILTEKCGMNCVSFTLRLEFIFIKMRFVQNKPIQSQLFYGFGELVEIHRFADVAVAAVQVSVDNIGLFVRGRQNYRGNWLCSVMVFDSF